MTKRQLVINEFDRMLRDKISHVFEWRTVPLSENEKPGIVYRDTLFDLIDGNIGTFRWSLRIEIAVFASSAAQTRELLSEVLQIVKEGDADNWGGIASDTVLISGELGVEQHDVINSAAVITVDIYYDTALWEM